jgi:serine/threonine-protein kinase
MSFQIGQEFSTRSRFRIARLIGQGGMGEVYEAKLLGAEGFQKTVALKTIREEFGRDRQFIDLFIEEAALVARLVHENIVQIYELGVLDGLHFIAMEYVDGIDLRRFQRRHQELGRVLPIELCVFIVSRVCRALAYAHARTDDSGQPLEVVHRDISPENVMITWGGVVKLADFGIAKAPGFGKPSYMSPEQARGEVVDVRTDIFALGVVLYELLSGSPLFSASGVEATLHNVLGKPIVPIRKVNPNVAEKIESILGKALAREPKLRYADAGDMGNELEHYMYHDRYGPTNLKLKDYLDELFPGGPETGSATGASEKTPGTLTL